MFRFLRYFGGATIAAIVLAIPFLISSAGTSSKIVSVIVQLRDEPAAVYQARAKQSGTAVSADQLAAYRSQLSAKQTDFLNALSAKGLTYTAVTRGIKGFDGSTVATIPLRYSLVLNAINLNIPESEIDAIREMPQVKSVSPDETLRTSLDHSVKYIRAPQVYGGPNEVAVSSKGFSAKDSNVLGQNVNVAIIDTGVDWTHPMLGGDATPPRLAVQPTGLPAGSTGSDNFNKKVIYYLPLTDSAVYDGFGHGTHVASTVAGYFQQIATGEQIHGVAPQAKIMSYKVCSDVEVDLYELSAVAGAPDPLGGCDSANIIMALEDSVSPTALPTIETSTGAISNPASWAFGTKPVAQVINMSLGGSGGPNEPTAIAASNAALAGAVVVAASGNSGPGEGTTGSPAAGTHVISVGATTHPGNAGAAYQVNVSGGPSGLIANKLSGSAAIPANLAGNYVYCGLADTPDQIPDSVRGRIALARRGSTVDLSASGSGVLVNKAAQAAAKGAIAILVYNNVDGELTGVNAFAATIPVLGLSKASGETLKSLIGSDAFGAVSAKQVQVVPSQVMFMGDMADFSSRGPVRGYGQVKPDISAPGVNVLAACPAGSFLSALAAVANPTTPNYIKISGTSMATPHTAGAAALIKQAHDGWSPDVVRTALINTATNMRDTNGGSKADGTGTADSIIAQGGGLIDVYHAINAKALMGVTGDGIEKPSILGSYSYGEVPVANNRITYTAPVEVTIRDLSGQGGTYNLSVANNRDVQLDGIGVSLSQTSVSVPANGSATFTVNATFDGNLLRDPTTPEAVVEGNTVTFVPRQIQMQWYVTAQRSDGAESLRMPFYYRPGPSLPAQPDVQTLIQKATVPAASGGQQLINGVDYVDVPFTVSDSTYKVEATVEWFTLPTGSLQDVDYKLLDPDGKVIASSGGPAGDSEHVSVRVTRGGTYRHRLVGFANAATDVTVTTVLSKGPAGPTASSFAGDFVDSSNNKVDFDGNVNLQWTPTGGELSYEIEHSLNGGDWELLATADGNARSFALNNLPDGIHSFRLRGLHQGQIGKYVTPAGSAASVLVSARTKVDITSTTGVPLSNMSCCTGGVWSANLTLTNNSGTTYLPYVDFNIIRVTSSSGTVRVKNAENGKSGIDSSNPAAFSFTSLIGSDQLFTPAEVTGAKNIQFYNNGELFSWDVLVTAYVGTGSASSSSSSSSGAQSSASSSGGGITGILPSSQITSVMRFTYNPLTNTVTKQLVSLK